MPQIVADDLQAAARLLRTRIAGAALGRYLRRRLSSRRADVAKNLEPLVRRKPERWAAGWTTTDPTVWRPSRAARRDGPLAGKRLVIKDSLDVRGAARSSGGMVGRGVAVADSALVERAREGGALIVGKVQMTELGVGGLGVQTHYGTLDNPLAPGHLPGGSSSGTAVAIASGMADMGIGTDALGSVRIPAAFCGLVGLKPTHGALSLRGYDTVAPSLDCPGPMARTAEECAALWRVMSDSTRTPWGVTARAPKRIGVVEQLGAVPVWQPIADAQAKVLKKLGSKLVEVKVATAPAATTAGAICGARELADAIAVQNVGVEHAAPLVAFSVAMGRSVKTSLYDQALGVRHRLRQEVLAALDGVDVLAMPTTAIPPLALTTHLAQGGADTDAMKAVGAFTPLASVTGLPAISIPIGESPDGRPLAMMLVARPGGEERLLSAAAAVEQIL